MSADRIYTHRTKSAFVRIVQELCPIILSATGVPVRPEFFERLVIKLEELHGAGNSDEFQRSIGKAKRALAGDSGDNEHEALWDLMCRLGHLLPPCDCADYDSDEGHDEDCPRSAWEAAE